MNVDRTKMSYNNPMKGDGTARLSGRVQSC